jgi:CubicO group peptidase (beta-lactamase class C family)
VAFLSFLDLNAFGPLSPDLSSKVDKLFSKWDHSDSPGCALGIVEDGTFVYEKGYGSSNLDFQIPNTTETVFYVGSVSKQFTAAAVLKLEGEGKVDLDKSLRSYFTEFPEWASQPTIRQMLHHTSGIPDIYELMGKNGFSLRNVFPDQRAMGLIAAKGTPTFQPGSKYEYSNSGYFLLSQLFERVGEGSLREFSQSEIFDPLRMHRSHFHDSPGHVITDRATSYSRNDKGEIGVSYLSNFDKVGAGGLYTTVRDLQKWDENFYSSTVLGRVLLEKLQESGRLNNGEKLDYAFGLTNSELMGRHTVGHTGSMMGFKAAVLRIPAEHLSVICLCNLEEIEPGELVKKIASLYFEPSN